MDVQHLPRASKDRRQFVLYYRYGNERRNNTGNRRQGTVEELQPYFTGTASHDHGRATDREVGIIQKIAYAFGVDPDSLELVDHDELLNNEICQSCQDRAIKEAELNAELAESPKGVVQPPN